MYNYYASQHIHKCIIIGESRVNKHSLIISNKLYIIPRVIINKFTLRKNKNTKKKEKNISPIFFIPSLYLSPFYTLKIEISNFLIFIEFLIDLNIYIKIMNRNKIEILWTLFITRKRRSFKHLHWMTWVPASFYTLFWCIVLHGVYYISHKSFTPLFH